MALPFRGSSGRVWPAGLLLAAVTALLLPGVAQAQQRDGYLLNQPRLSLFLNLGYAAPRAQSEVFDLTRENLTVDTRDLDAVGLTGGLAIRVTDRIDATAEFGWSRSEVFSEFREWVDQDDLPIQQTTTFTRRPLTVGARAFLRDRGQRVGSFAWVPGSWAPYVGGGVGVMFYDFTQEGDFVDFETFDIFSDRLRSSGSGFTAHLLAGLEFSLTPHLVATTEGRYRFGSAGMNRDFPGGPTGFDDIDLSGLELSLGFGLRF